MGPTVTPSSTPRPTTWPAIRAASRRANSSATERCTWNRLAAVHASPPLRIFAAIAPSTAASRSASANTRNGALPPSSIEVRSTLSAHCASSVRPTAVEPVKDSLRTEPPRISGSMSAPASVVGTVLTHAVRQASLPQDLGEGQHRQRRLRAPA